MDRQRGRGGERHRSDTRRERDDYPAEWEHGGDYNMTRPGYGDHPSRAESSFGYRDGDDAQAPRRRPAGEDDRRHGSLAQEDYLQPQSSRGANLGQWTDDGRDYPSLARRGRDELRRGGHYGGGYGGGAGRNFSGGYGSGYGGGYEGDYDTRGAGDYGGAYPGLRGYAGDREPYGGDASGRRQNFRGRGPRDYRRSDARLREDVCERLADDPDLDASDIDVEVEDGHVVLQGRVDERWLKYHAEDIADRCAGVRDIENRLTVGQRSDAGQIGGHGAPTPGS